MRGTRMWLAVLVLMALAACASGGSQMTALERAQYDWSAAIRWGNFEGAWTLVEPAYRDAHPISAIEFERYKQVQVSGYTDLATQVAPDGLNARREIQVGVINKHTMTERSIRYTETWRYDAEKETWWITSGLPDFWAGM